LTDVYDPLADARAVHDTVSSGGVAIFKADVGYAIVGHTEPAIRRIYEAKNRSFSKPCGMFGSWAIFQEIIDIDSRARDYVRAVIFDHRLPISVVAPFRADHPFFKSVAPFVLANASKAGTMDVLMNAGPTHDEIARIALEESRPVFGSSANRSLAGSKFVFKDIEPEVLEATDLALDRGHSKYSNDRGLGSSIIDLRNFQPVRIGICFNELRAVASQHFGIDIPDRLPG
jgi:tRNA A37 threonylcarbamoyladenosine synthetase subunit TsaC/SUA5/YrdC